MCTNNYSDKQRFDKVIAKMKWCSFLINSVYEHSILYNSTGNKFCRNNTLYGVQAKVTQQKLQFLINNLIFYHKILRNYLYLSYRYYKFYR